MTEKQKWHGVLTHVYEAIKHLRKAMKILGSGSTHGDINSMIGGPLLDVHAMAWRMREQAAKAEEGA